MDRLAELAADQHIQHVRGQSGAVQGIVHADIGHTEIGAAQVAAHGQVTRGDQDRPGIARADPERDRAGQGGERDEDPNERARIGTARPSKRGANGAQSCDGHGIWQSSPGWSAHHWPGARVARQRWSRPSSIP